MWTLARVVSIYKKGDPSKQSNYRPISLLNTLYKILARVVKIRLAEGMEKELWETQYGFRAGRSTSDAIHIVRRTQDYVRNTGVPGLLCLLDWERRLTNSGLKPCCSFCNGLGYHARFVPLFVSYTRTLSSSLRSMVRKASDADNTQA